LEPEHLERVVNDGTRKITLRGREALVPLKFGKDGRPATQRTLLLKRLTLDDLRFLQLWREASWDIAKARQDSGLLPERVERLVKKLQVFREEDAKVKALSEIPTPSWISAKHVENVYDGGTLEDSEHKSLAELAKISGAYKPTTNVNLNFNAFVKPELSPEDEKKTREFFDTIATTENAA